MSPASVASRRIRAALPASCAALTSSACAAASSSGGSIAAAMLQNLRPTAFDDRAERGGRRAGQRLDVFERRLQRCETLSGPAIASW